MSDMYDVVVVGLGPVGACLGNVLGKLGLKVLITEQTDGLETRPRAAAMDDENIRLLSNLGLADEFIATTVSAPDLQMVSSYLEAPAGAPPPMLLSGLASAEEGVGKPGAWPEWKRPVPLGRNGFKRENRMFYQPELERILRAGVSRFPNVKIEVSQRCVGVANVPGGVEIQLQRDDGKWEPRKGGEVVFASSPNGDVRIVRSRYIIGCDGARSVARDLCIGPELVSLDYDERWWAIDLMLKDDSAFFGSKIPHYGHFNIEQTRCYIILPGARVWDRPEKRRHVRIDIQLIKDDPEELLETEEYVRSLIRPWLADEDYDIVRFSLYRFWSLLAAKWQKQNVFLVGDSCHTTPPFLGQGLNQGMKDAANLSWKIAMVLRGQATEQVLETYQQEREKVVRDVVGGAVTMGRVSEEFKAAQAKGQDALVAAVKRVSDEKRGFESGFSMGATKMLHGDLSERSAKLLKTDRITGQTVPNCEVITEAGRKFLDQAIGDWNVVLLCVSQIGQEPTLSKDALKLMQRHGIKPVRLALGTPEPGCAYRAELSDSHEFVRQAPCAVLIRPDRFVYGMTRLDDVDVLVEQFDRYLRPSTTSRL